LILVVGDTSILHHSGLRWLQESFIRLMAQKACAALVYKEQLRGLFHARLFLCFLCRSEAGIGCPTSETWQCCPKWAR